MMHNRSKKLRLTLTTLLSLSVTIGILLGHEAHGKEVSIKGEIVDLQCYLVHPANSTGASHAKCAQACMNRGLPSGLLTADGKLFLLLGPGHESANGKVSRYAGKVVTVRGVLTEEQGLHAIQIKSVTE